MTDRAADIDLTGRDRLVLAFGDTPRASFSGARYGIGRPGPTCAGSIGIRTGSDESALGFVGVQGVGSDGARQKNSSWMLSGSRKVSIAFWVYAVG